MPFPQKTARTIQVTETCNALCGLGAKVDLFWAGCKGRGWREAGLSFYGVKPYEGLRLHQIPSLLPSRTSRLRLSWRTPFDLLCAACFSAMTGRSGKERWVLYTRDLDLARRLFPIARRRGILAVYEAHDLKQRAMAAEAEEAGRRPNPAKLARIVRLEKTVFLSADAVTAVSEGTVDAVRSVCPETDVHLVPNGVRLLEREETRVGGVPGGPVAYSGHLYGWKGVERMIQALKALPGIPFFILGGDEDPSHLEKLRTRMAEAGLMDRGTLRGFVPPSEVRSHLVQARALILSLPDTHYNRHFTCPLKLLEYMTTGVPIVASDLPTVASIARHDREAWLVAPDEVSALTQGIRRVVDDTELSQRLGRAALERVGEYSWEERARKILALAE